MAIQRWRYSQTAGNFVEQSDGGVVFYSDHLAAMQREREVRAQLVEALEGAANLRLFVGNYDGKMFDKAKLFAIIDKADAALLAAKELG